MTNDPLVDIPIEFTVKNVETGERIWDVSIPCTV